MKAGFYTIMAAQFFSSLADNALLIAAIRLLQELQEPEWMLPSLQQSFVVSYVVLAPIVGAVSGGGAYDLLLRPCSRCCADELKAVAPDRRLTTTEATSQ